MLQVKLSLSSAECNCLIEAIEAANRLIETGQQVYAVGGFEAETLECQQSYVSVTAAIAETLKQLIDDEETAIIAFEP